MPTLSSLLLLFIPDSFSSLAKNHSFGVNMWGSTQSTFTIINNFLLHLRSTVYSTNATAVFYYNCARDVQLRRDVQRRECCKSFVRLQICMKRQQLSATLLSLNESTEGEKLGRNKRSILPLFAALNFLFYFK